MISSPLERERPWIGGRLHEVPRQSRSINGRTHRGAGQGLQVMNTQPGQYQGADVPSTRRDAITKYSGDIRRYAEFLVPGTRVLNARSILSPTRSQHIRSSACLEELKILWHSGAASQTPAGAVDRHRAAASARGSLHAVAFEAVANATPVQLPSGR